MTRTASATGVSIFRSLVTVLAVTGLLLAGCASTNEIRTDASSDGLRAELGGLLLSNLMVLSAGESQPGTVLGAVANHGEGVATVSIGLEDATSPASFEVPEGATLLLGPEDQRVRVQDMPQPPGAVVSLRIISDRDGQIVRRVPVLDATLDYYEGLVPTSSPTS